MNTSEIERILAQALHADAEDLMNRTDTKAELQALVRETQRDTRRRRLVWAGGAVAAAAAVAAIVVLVTGGDKPSIEPAGPVDEATQAEQVATDFLNAYAAFDRDLAASYVADDATVSLGEEAKRPDTWLLRNRWDEATALDMQFDGCFEHGSAAAGTYVSCSYSVNRMHSAELGLGPFGPTILELTIQDGEIVESRIAAWDQAEHEQVFDPFLVWIDETHPEDRDLLFAWETADPATVNRSLRLWKHRTQEYADAVLAGEVN